MRNSMGRFIKVIFFLLIVIPVVNAQPKLNPIMAIRQDADSVWIVSHEATGVYIQKANGQSEELVLFKDGELDSSLIKETRLLGTADRIRLAKLLSRPNTERKIEMTKCFMPQHTIVWRTGGKVSWIEVCLSCQKLRESDDLKISLSSLDNPKWRALRSFFKQNGLTYGL